MTNCLVLSDKEVHEILIDLPRDDIIKIQKAIEKALQDFSTTEEREYQPEPSTVKRPNGQKVLFRPFTSVESVGVKIIVSPAKPREPLHGMLALLDENGLPTGFMNGEEVTGYRTSLGALILYAHRKVTDNIVIFGAGKQALWHMRLALALRGPEIKRITIINRSADRSQSLVEQIKQENQARWKSSADISFVDFSQLGESESEKKTQGLLADADAVFCTTPSKEVLFPAKFLTERGSNSKSCYVSAIGSWTSDMIELDPQLLRHAADLSSDYKPRPNQEWGVVVDNREEVLKSSGEIIRSKLEAGQIAEVGEVLATLEKSSGEESANMKQWLGEGLIVFKSSGVSIMDLAAANAILSLAKDRSKGLQVSDF